MKPSAVAAALGIAESTVRKYASEYAEFLSPGGAGGGHRHRDFAEHDVRVLKLICDMKTENTTSADIDVTLQSLKSNNWERLPALDETSQGLVTTPGALMVANTEKSVMQREIELLRERIESLKAEREAEQEAVRSDRDALLQRLHRAETLLELYESGRLKPKE
jgi:DNA-binding transcriptional MerR regulator